MKFFKLVFVCLLALGLVFLASNSFAVKAVRVPIRHNAPHSRALIDTLDFFSDCRIFIFILVAVR